MFNGISDRLCEDAWSLLYPTLREAADTGVTNKFAGCIVVLDPRATYRGQPTVEDVVLYTSSIHMPEPDDANDKYVRIAMAKAYVTFKHRMPSAVVQQRYPYLYEDGDTKWGGSTITPGGLIVAFSGVQAHFDEMIAEMLASIITALCRDGMLNKDRGVMFQDTSFIGEVPASNGG